MVWTEHLYNNDLVCAIEEDVFLSKKIYVIEFQANATLHPVPIFQYGEYWLNRFKYVVVLGVEKTNRFKKRGLIFF